MKKLYAIMAAAAISLPLAAQQHADSYFPQEQRAAEAATNVYKGKLVVKMTGNELTAPGGDDATINITPKGDGKCDFLLPDFSLSTLGPLGDINVENVEMTVSGSTTTYKGEVKDLELLNGNIKADVIVTGTEQADGTIAMNIAVTWSGIPIECTFNGKKESAGISGIVAEDNAPAEFFRLNGVSTGSSAPAPGIYIRRQGGKAVKVIVR